MGAGTPRRAARRAGSPNVRPGASPSSSTMRSAQPATSQVAEHRARGRDARRVQHVVAVHEHDRVVLHARSLRQARCRIEAAVSSGPPCTHVGVHLAAHRPGGGLGLEPVERDPEPEVRVGLARTDAYQATRYGSTAG